MRYEITVWDIENGDIVRKLWDASEDELNEVEDEFGDDPGVEVQAEEKG